MGWELNKDSRIDVLDALADKLIAKNFSAQKVYPTQAASVQVRSSASAWVLGTKAELVPASTITSAFTITGIDTTALFEATTYEIVLYSGAIGSEVEIGRVRFTNGVIGANINGHGEQLEVSTPILPANTRISVAMASTYDLSTKVSIRYVLI